MHLVALTGSAAAGKSSVSALFRRWGASVVDADAIVRSLQRAGTPLFRAIVAEFGPTIVGVDGELDRPALRHLVLADPAARKRLEALTHPAVERACIEQLATARANGTTLVIVDIPLLFESADPAAYDGIVVVDAPPALRRRRLIEQRGLVPADADRLIAAQMPDAEKRARATWIITNDGSEADLEERARMVWEALPR